MEDWRPILLNTKKLDTAVDFFPRKCWNSYFAAEDLFHSKCRNTLQLIIYFIENAEIKYGYEYIPMKKAKIKYNLGFIP